MAAYWLVFGLITTFYPRLMDLFQTETGVHAKTAFSNHIWQHDGLDIISISVLLFALSRAAVSRGLLLAAATAALLVTCGIFFSLFSTSYWSGLFIVPGVGCLGFSVWGFVLASAAKNSVESIPGQQASAQA